MRVLPAVLLTLALAPVKPVLGQEPTLKIRHGGLVQLRVSVFNSVAISPSIMGRAQDEAGRVLRDAGVKVIWLNCPQDAQLEAFLGRCLEVSFPRHLHLRIVRSSRGLKASTVGVSFSDQDGRGCCADLFYEPIQQLQEETNIPSSVILGHAMAHELGHLLLGINSHSPNGLMRAHWSHEDLIDMGKGRLRFSHEQSLRIRNHLAQGDPQNQQATGITLS